MRVGSSVWYQNGFVSFVWGSNLLKYVCVTCSVQWEIILILISGMWFIEISAHVPNFLNTERVTNVCLWSRLLSFDTFWEKTTNKIKYSTSFPSDSSTFINLLAWAQHQRRGSAAAGDWVCLCMVSIIMFATKASVVIWTHNSYSYSGSRKDPLLSKMIFFPP